MNRIIGLSLALALISLSTLANAQVTQTYTYDAHGRLTGATNAASTSGTLTSYWIDSADNRLARDRYSYLGVSVANQLRAGEWLLPSQKLTSTDSRFELRFDQDGHVRLYFGAIVLWDIAANIDRPPYFMVGVEGNVYLANPYNGVIWQSGTAGNPGAFLDLRNDGNLVLWDSPGTTVLWQSNTCCH